MSNIMVTRGNGLDSFGCISGEHSSIFEPEGPFFCAGLHNMQSLNGARVAGCIEGDGTASVWARNEMRDELAIWTQDPLETGKLLKQMGEKLIALHHERQGS